jgi:hypothetical protein
MSKYKNISMLVILLLAAVSMIVLIFREDKKECQLNNILVNPDLPSKDWLVEWIILPPALPSFGAQNAISISLVNSNGDHLFNTVYDYKNRLLASIFLKVNEQVFYPSTSRTWKPKNDFSTQDVVHDVRCTEGLDTLSNHRCVSVTQYNRYLVVFSAPMGDEGISNEEFETILQKMDKTFTHCDGTY